MTAVQWFNQQLVDKQIGKGDSRDWDTIFEQAKEMEKEQIKNAFHKNSQKWFCEEEAEQYYNEKFNK
jgi:hypothetical protein